jgi:hypothetical protein
VCVCVCVCVCERERERERENEPARGNQTREVFLVLIFCLWFRKNEI